MKDLIQGTDGDDYLISYYDQANIMTGGEGWGIFHIEENRTGYSDIITDFGQGDVLTMSALTHGGGVFDMDNTVNGLEINVTYPHDPDQYSQTVILNGIKSHEIIQVHVTITMRNHIEGTDGDDLLHSYYNQANIMTGGVGADTFILQKTTQATAM